MTNITINELTNKNSIDSSDRFPLQSMAGTTYSVTFSTLSSYLNSSVSNFSFNSTNGFSGSVLNPTTTPTLTLGINISGILKGNGVSISAATAGVDYIAPGTLTTADVATSSNKRYLTDAQLTVVGNTSGTNTGDQTNISGNSGSTNAIKSATTTIDVSSATAPVAGQVLTATSNTTATWQSQSQLSPLITVSNNYTIVNDDYFINCTSSSKTLTLPTAVGNSGRSFQIINSSSGIITVDTTSSQTINGELTQTLPSNSCMSAVSDGSNYLIF